MTFLWLLTAGIFLAAAFKQNAAAMAYAILIGLHTLMFGYLAEDAETVHLWGMTAGVFTFISMLACYHLRRGVNDNIAYYLYNVGILTLLVNILTVYMAMNRMNMESLTPVFASISLISIIFISKGRGRGSRNRIMYRDRRAKPAINQRIDRAAGLVRTEETRT